VLEHLDLLDTFSVDVQWKVIGVDDTLDEVQVSGHKFLELFVDEHSTDVELKRARSTVVVLI